MPLDRRNPLRLEESLDVPQAEIPADDGRARQDGSLTRTEAIEARGEQRLDRRRQRSTDERSFFCDEREQLLEEEGVSLRGLDHAVDEIRREGSLADELLHEGGRL